MIVIDASALLEILLQTPRAEKLMQRALDPKERMHAPQLLDIEVTQVLRRMTQRKELPVGRAEQALEDFTHIVIERHDHQSLIPRIWELCDSVSAYDGAYVALAEALSAPLLTCDGKLARAPGLQISVELIPL